MLRVFNVVPEGTKHLERVNGGWVLRYGYQPTEQEGFVKCVERLLAQSRRPKMEVIKRIVESDGYAFNEETTKTEGDSRIARYGNLVIYEQSGNI